MSLQYYGIHSVVSHLSHFLYHTELVYVVFARMCDFQLQYTIKYNKRVKPVFLMKVHGKMVVKNKMHKATHTIRTCARSSRASARSL